ncbi:enoyl-CoA hydratase-related protein, partial [Nocardia abscessus]|uniref:enoyl-CoA hydratase-related protein n=1 Tax=Nocardia abscessus TaxID=120957 RepID=UPI002456A74A
GGAVLGGGGALSHHHHPPPPPPTPPGPAAPLRRPTELVLATDLVVAAKTARFGVPEVKRGLVAGGGALLRLPRRIPYQKALELALTGDNFTAEDAAAWGFVNDLAERGQALDRALALADRITANGPIAVAVTKEVIVKAGEWSAEEMWQKQIELIAPVFTTQDAQEGAQAFAEKRTPNWTGK